MASGLPPASSGHKSRLPELLLGPLLVLLFSGFGPVVGQKLYTNTWAVHIPGGQEVAEQVASKHGFINYGHVSSAVLFCAPPCRRFNGKRAILVVDKSL